MKSSFPSRMGRALSPLRSWLPGGSPQRHPASRDAAKPADRSPAGPLGLFALTGATVAWAVTPLAAGPPFVTRYPTGPETTSAAAGDFNRDGRTDLVVASNDPEFPAVTILYGQGDGRFLQIFPGLPGGGAPALARAAGGGGGALDWGRPHDRAVADLDGDGSSDVAIARGPRALPAGD